jgi:chaperone required for assembly of F1-ATPase
VTGWAARRFWTLAAVAPLDDGFTVALDGRPVMTPARAALRLPSLLLAEAIAEEWNRQRETIRPEAMLLTRAANTAIDRVPAHRAAIVAELAGWGETDLLCHRAEAPEALAERQRLGWDPLLDWAAAALGARLSAVAGVMPCPQPATALATLRAEVARQDDFALVALSELVVLSGSLILGLATLHGRTAPGDAWRLSRIDEDWQTGQWGVDSAAASAAEARRGAFLQAHRFLTLSRPGARTGLTDCA